MRWAFASIAGRRPRPTSRSATSQLEGRGHDRAEPGERSVVARYGSRFRTRIAPRAASVAGGVSSSHAREGTPTLASCFSILPWCRRRGQLGENDRQKLGPLLQGDLAQRSMLRRCEICEAGSDTGAVAGKLRRLLVGDRIVALCMRHAEAAEAFEAATIDQLRALFVEPGGRRSLLDRRSPLDRRVFPARPEGRRAAAGRRTSDEPSG